MITIKDNPERERGKYTWKLELIGMNRDQMIAITTTVAHDGPTRSMIPTTANTNSLDQSIKAYNS